MTIKTYDHARFGKKDAKPFPPCKVQILIGDSPNEFSFVSTEMLYDREKPFEHQHFRLEQYFAVGKFVKIMLIGKPQIQKGIDDKHYLALSNVGITAHKCRDQLIDQNIQKELAPFAQVLNALQKNLSNDLLLMGEALLAHSE